METKMTTPREHVDAAALYFADKTTKCWAREKNSNRNWTLLRDPTFRSSDLEYHVGHEPPPPYKRTVTLTVNGKKWVLPAPLRGDETCVFWYFSETGGIKWGFNNSDYYNEIRALIKHNGGGLYASKEDAKEWAEFNKWCREGGV